MREMVSSTDKLFKNVIWPAYSLDKSEHRSLCAATSEALTVFIQSRRDRISTVGQTV